MALVSINSPVMLIAKPHNAVIPSEKSHWFFQRWDD